MITDEKYFTKNALTYLVAEFLWNLGRTFPHAILTILLLDIGVSLEGIAILQIIYMIVVIFGEFPSGVISDHFSRKIVYSASICMIAIAYFLILISKGNFILLSISWGLYGLSVAIKSGTLDNEIVLEYRNEKKSIKKLMVNESYVASVSSIAGAFIGSIFYEAIGINFYIITIIILFFSLLISFLYKPKLKVQREKVEFKAFFNEVKLGLKLFFVKKNLKLIIFIFSFSAFFFQTLFQYWQVLYANQGISITLFGYVYVILQVANIIGTYIYKKISTHFKYTIFLLLFIPISTIFIIWLFDSTLFFITFPIVVIVFYIYYQFINVLLKENSPKEYMSTFTSLVSSCINMLSIVSLIIISMLFSLFTVSTVYIVMFSLFSITSIICILSYLKIG